MPAGSDHPTDTPSRSAPEEGASAEPLSSPVIVVKESARSEGRSPRLVVEVHYPNGQIEPHEFQDVGFDSSRPLHPGGGGAAIPKHPLPHDPKTHAHWLRSDGIT